MSSETTESAPVQRHRGRLVLLIILALDAVALLLCAWLWLSAAPGAAEQVRQSENNLMRFKERAESLAAQVDRIKTDRLETVSVPSELIAKVATQGQIREHVTIGKPVTRNWKKESNYEQVVTDVTFLKKTGYPLMGLVAFMQNIENTNPKVQIAYINFGQATPDEQPGTFIFHPVKMDVRVFNPKASR